MKMLDKTKSNETHWTWCLYMKWNTNPNKKRWKYSKWNGIWSDVARTFALDSFFLIVNKHRGEHNLAKTLHSPRHASVKGWLILPSHANIIDGDAGCRYQYANHQVHRSLQTRQQNQNHAQNNEHHRNDEVDTDRPREVRSRREKKKFNKIEFKIFEIDQKLT